MGSISMASGKVSFEELWSALLTGTFIRITHAGWSATNVGTGSTAQVPTGVRVQSGTTTGSSGLLAASLEDTYIGQASATVNWAKKLNIKVRISVNAPDANTTAYFQLKAASTTHGDLAAKGMGFKISNVTLVGEVHDGTTRSTVGSSTLTAGTGYEVAIQWNGSDLWEILRDGVSLGTLATNLPSSTTGSMYWVVSAGNGAGTSNTFIDCALEMIAVAD